MPTLTADPDDSGFFWLVLLVGAVAGILLCVGYGLVVNYDKGEYETTGYVVDAVKTSGTGRLIYLAQRDPTFGDIAPVEWTCNLDREHAYLMSTILNAQANNKSITIRHAQDIFRACYITDAYESVEEESCSEWCIAHADEKRSRPGCGCAIPVPPQVPGVSHVVNCSGIFLTMNITCDDCVGNETFNCACMPNPDHTINCSTWIEPTPPSRPTCEYYSEALGWHTGMGNTACACGHFDVCQPACPFEFCYEMVGHGD